jgi:hypothetical protein
LPSALPRLMPLTSLNWMRARVVLRGLNMTDNRSTRASGISTTAVAIWLRPLKPPVSALLPVRAL